MTIQESDFSSLKAAGYKFPEPFKVKAADGVTDLYGVMYKPFDFDSTKVYPIIDYVYPGPQVEAVDYPFRRMSVRTDRLAQAGFIVITVGQRGGHPSRSKWYHNYGYGNMRDYPLADHKAAVEQLADRYSLLILRVWEFTDTREVALCRQQQSASILISTRLQFLVPVIMITVSITVGGVKHTMG